MVIKKTSSEFHNWDEDGSNNKALAKRNLNIFYFYEPRKTQLIVFLKYLDAKMQTHST